MPHVEMDDVQGGRALLGNGGTGPSAIAEAPSAVIAFDASDPARELAALRRSSETLARTWASASIRTTQIRRKNSFALRTGRCLDAIKFETSIAPSEREALLDWTAD